MSDVVVPIVEEVCATDATATNATVDDTLTSTTTDHISAAEVEVSVTVEGKVEVQNDDMKETVTSTTTTAAAASASASAVVDLDSTSNGITTLQLLSRNSMDCVNDTTGGDDSTPTTTTADPATNENTVIDQTTKNDRPWDFSNRKVIIQGVDKFHDVKTTTKILHKWLDTASTTTTSSSTSTNGDLNPSLFVIDKIKKPPKSNWLLVTLQNESMIQPFINFINNSNIKNRKGNNVFAKAQQAHHNDEDDDHRNQNSKCHLTARCIWKHLRLVSESLQQLLLTNSTV